MAFNKFSSATLLLGIFLASMGVTGCTSQEESGALSLIQTALSDLTQNRALAEQFVRDVKADVTPADPAYQQAQDSYESARDAYNHFLDTVETDDRSGRSSRSLRSADAIMEARNATADFLADATSALKPSIAARRIPFQRAVVIPDGMQRSLQKMPKRDREAIVDRFDRQVRWRSWGQL